MNDAPDDLQETPDDDPDDCGEIEDYDENDLSSRKYLIFWKIKSQVNLSDQISREMVLGKVTNILSFK